MSTQLPYRPHTLRLQALRPLDETAVRLFLKLAQQRLRQAWIMVDDRAPIEADVVLLPPGEHPQRGRRVVWVLAPGQEAPQDGHPVLTRPLQLEAFYEVLQALGAARPAVVPIIAEPAPPQTPTRYRLQRWPGSQLLGQHPQGARLASFLSARYLSATELARLSHAPSEACARFIHAMRQNKLVEVQTPPSDTATPEPMTARQAPAWIGLLRHKLQLTDTLQPIG